MVQRVLIIEDDNDLALAMFELLSMMGLEVQVAPDGVVGYELAQRFAPQVVFCDLSLPGINGFETARLLRAHPATTHARLIALSGDQTKVDARRPGADDFDSLLLKPVDGPALTALLTS